MWLAVLNQLYMKAVQKCPLWCYCRKLKPPRKELRLVLHSSLETSSVAFTDLEDAMQFMCVWKMVICFLVSSLSLCFICHSSSWTYTGTIQRAGGCSPDFATKICSIYMFLHVLFAGKFLKNQSNNIILSFE